MQSRVQLVETAIPLLTGKKVLLLADREFIGEDQFQALKCLGVQPTIQLLAASRVDSVPVWVCFKKVKPNELAPGNRHIWDAYAGSCLQEPRWNNTLTCLSRRREQGHPSVLLALEHRKHIKW